MTATLHDDGLFHSMIFTGKEYIQCEPLRDHAADLDEHTHKLLSEQAVHGMVAYRLSDFLNRKKGQSDQDVLLESINEKLGTNIPLESASTVRVSPATLNSNFTSASKSSSHLSYVEYTHYAQKNTCCLYQIQSWTK
jgi:hypothetical protein